MRRPAPLACIVVMSSAATGCSAASTLEREWVVRQVERVDAASIEDGRRVDALSVWLADGTVHHFGASKIEVSGPMVRVNPLAGQGLPRLLRRTDIASFELEQIISSKPVALTTTEGGGI